MTPLFRSRILTIGYSVHVQDPLEGFLGDTALDEEAARKRFELLLATTGASQFLQRWNREVPHKDHVSRAEYYAFVDLTLRGGVPIYLDDSDQDIRKRMRAHVGQWLVKRDLTDRSKEVLGRFLAERRGNRSFRLAFGEGLHLPAWWFGVARRPLADHENIPFDTLARVWGVKPDTIRQYAHQLTRWLSESLVAH
jgi:hypothetical protein